MIKKIVYVLVFTFILLSFQDVGLFAENRFSVIANGYLQSDFPSQNTVITDLADLDNLKNKLGITNTDIEVDFSNESIVFIVPDESNYPDQIFIKNVESQNNKSIKVHYTLNKIPYVINKDEVLSKPFMIAKINNSNADINISFVFDGPIQPLFVNQSLGEVSRYSNILKQLDNELFLKYIPLDKGNSWTYEFETDTSSGKQTFNIISFADGWSVFDNYFGKLNIGMKIDTAGNIFVSSKQGISAFYTNDVKVINEKSGFTVGAGNFNDLLIVTSHPDSKFKFKDIYAKDIGLIYHEHKSERGSAKYSLTKAIIRGKNIP